MSTTDIITLNNIGHYSNGTLIVGFRAAAETTLGTICVEFNAGEQDVSVKLEANFTVDNCVTKEHVERVAAWLDKCVAEHVGTKQMQSINHMLVTCLPAMCI